MGKGAVSFYVESLRIAVAFKWVPKARCWLEYPWLLRAASPSLKVNMVLRGGEGEQEKEHSPPAIVLVIPGTG